MQVSRSIGDEYMKHARFNQEPINPKFRISGPMNMPILSANPSIMSHELQQNDLFLIFASDGLWEHLTNDKAVEIVNSHPHMVCLVSLLTSWVLLIFLVGRLLLRSVYRILHHRKLIFVHA